MTEEEPVFGDRWRWDLHMEVYISDLIRDNPHLVAGKRTAAITWLMKRVTAHFPKASLDSCAAAVAHHVCKFP